METQLTPIKNTGMRVPIATSLKPAGTAKATRQPPKEARESDMPRVLEGNPQAAQRVIERWLSAANRSFPVRSMAAAIALQNGWILDDATGRLVARVDVGWLLNRTRLPHDAPACTDEGTPDVLLGRAANDAHIRAA
jgi:hypothetical protein